MSGVVVESVDRGTACRFKLDDGTVKYALNWMLSKDDGAGTPTAPPTAKTGAYVCSLGPAGTFNLVLDSDTRYSSFHTGNPPAQGAYSNVNGKLTFTSGPLAGNFGAVLSETKVGLSSKKDTKSYYATCHRS